MRKFGLDWFKSEVCKISGGGGGGHRSPLLGDSHVTGDAQFRTWPEPFQLKFLCENLVLIDCAFQELSYKQTKKKKKKKRSQTQLKTIPSKKLFSGR